MKKIQTKIYNSSCGTLESFSFSPFKKVSRFYTSIKKYCKYYLASSLLQKDPVNRGVSCDLQAKCGSLAPPAVSDPEVFVIKQAGRPSATAEIRSSVALWTSNGAVCNRRGICRRPPRPSSLCSEKRSNYISSTLWSAAVL